MLKVLGVLAIFACVLVGMGCLPAQQAPAQEKTRELLLAEDVVRKLHYVRDPRTCLCFAIYPKQSYNKWAYGPAMAHVPCDRVLPPILEGGDPSGQCD